MKSRQLVRPRGRPIRGSAKRARVSFTLPPELINWLREESRNEQQSLSQTLEVCISRARNELGNDSVLTLIERYPTVYWDINSSDIEPKYHSEFIIERMLEHGTLPGIRELFLVFSRDKIAEVVQRTKRISKKTALFWQTFLDIKGPIFCLEKESLTQLSKPWEE